MASLLELGISTGKWDAGLRKAQGSLNNFIQAQGGLSQAIDKENDKIGKFVGMMGDMTSSAKTAKGQMNDYKGTLEQLTAQYNQLTDAQKKTVGPEYINAIDKLKNKFREAKTQVEDFNRSLNGIDTSKMNGGGLFGGGKLGGILQVFGGNVMTKVAGAGVGLAGEMADMVTQGIELARQGEGIRKAFERLGRGDILDGLREATHGTVTDIELMKAAVKFNDFKLPIEELGTMLAFAQQKAKDTGQSVDYMVDSIVTGLGRKSLMILDNLGLSAAEIRDKMKETGDMTKAVGEIIREQMSKAGDYVETAADRATQANVRLQNKMEELGRKFGPVKEASDDLWTSIKIGIMDIVGGPLADLLNSLTRAGQLRNELKNIGSDERVNSDIAKLKGSNFKQEAYTAMLNKYSREEQKALDNFKKAQRGGMGSIAVWENRYLAQKSMREDFQARGSAIVNGNGTVTDSNPLPVVVKNTGGGGGGKESINLAPYVTAEGEKAIEHTPFSPLMNSADFMDALRKEMGMDGAMTRDWGKETGKVFASYVEDPYKNKRSNGKETNQDEKVIKDISTITGAVGNIMGGIQSLGLELPEGITQAIGMIQTISGILTAILTITTAINATQEVQTAVSAIPFLHTGGVVRAATGTVVPGNLGYDGVPAMLTSGEVVLNKAQQGALASELQDSGINGLHIVGEVEGEKIILVANRTFTRRGEGEIVTWKN